MSVRHEPEERLRKFHLPHAHLESAFGNDWFGRKAEDFARFFGTPTFLIAQTLIVALWIWVNATGWTQFDVYPFILLNLAFSTQAAYAAPLILLAQTRQADRDKVTSLADAQHREELHQISEQRQAQMREQASMLVEMVQQNTALTERVETLLKQNTELTQTVRTLVERIDAMTMRGPCADDAGRARLNGRPSAETIYLSMNSIVCSSAAGETLNRPV